MSLGSACLHASACRPIRTNSDGDAQTSETAQQRSLPRSQQHTHPPLAGPPPEQRGNASLHTSRRRATNSNRNPPRAGSLPAARRGGRSSWQPATAAGPAARRATPPAAPPPPAGQAGAVGGGGRRSVRERGAWQQRGGSAAGHHARRCLAAAVPRAAAAARQPSTHTCATVASMAVCMSSPIESAAVHVSSLQGGAVQGPAVGWGVAGAGTVQMAAGSQAARRTRMRPAATSAQASAHCPPARGSQVDDEQRDGALGRAVGLGPKEVDLELHGPPVVAHQRVCRAGGPG